MGFGKLLNERPGGSPAFPSPTRDYKIECEVMAKHPKMSKTVFKYTGITFVSPTLLLEVAKTTMSTPP